ncbi:serine/threonine-protein kinase Cx32 [Spatholobus suberectus]|nr:serine/threonine-protein kinase Cx32 [Spatholobus suberectus]
MSSADGEGSLPLPSPHGRILKWPNLKVYSLEELETAMKRFGNHAMAGPAVDIGSPCKAWLDGMVVFIKGGYCNETDSWAFQGWQIS